MKMIKDTLISLGLNETQIKAYLALLSSGTTPASVLARRVGIPRSTARYTCQQLVNKGMAIAGTKDNTLLFTAKDPESLFTLLEKDREALKKKSAEVSNIIGALKNMYNPKTTLPKVTFHEGVDGVINMLDDVFNYNETIYSVLKLTDNLNAEVMKYWKNNYLPKRMKLGQKARSIFNDNPITREYHKKDKDFNRISLLAPEEDFPFEQYFHIYGDKVAFFYGEGYDVGGIIIQDEHVKNTQLSLLKMAWNYIRTLKVNQAYKNVDLD